MWSSATPALRPERSCRRCVAICEHLNGWGLMGKESMATSSLYVHEGEITKGSELCQEVPAIEYPQHQWQGDVPSPVLPTHNPFQSSYDLMKKTGFIPILQLRKLRQPKQVDRALPEVPQLSGPDPKALIFASSPVIPLCKTSYSL